MLKNKTGDNKMKCIDCKNWERREDDLNYGLCKANAPSPIIVPLEEGRKYNIVWPSTGKDDWCVKYEKNEALQ